MKLASIAQAYRHRFEHKYADTATNPMRKAMNAVLACRIVALCGMKVASIG